MRPITTARYPVGGGHRRPAPYAARLSGPCRAGCRPACFRPVPCGADWPGHSRPRPAGRSAAAAAFRPGRAAGRRPGRYASAAARRWWPLRRRGAAPSGRVPWRAGVPAPQRPDYLGSLAGDEPSRFCPAAGICHLGSQHLPQTLGSLPVKAIRRFTVRAALPESLAPLRELTLNLRWSWHADTRDLFAAIDPAGWEAAGHDPLALLGEVPPAQLADPRRRPGLPAPARRRRPRPAMNTCPGRAGTS